MDRGNAFLLVAIEAERGAMCNRALSGWRSGCVTTQSQLDSVRDSLTTPLAILSVALELQLSCAQHVQVDEMWTDKQAPSPSCLSLVK